MFYPVIVALLALLSGPVHAGWQQTFSDEFTAPSVDFTKWQTMDSFGVNTLSGGGVQEQQCYEDAALSQSGGNLIVSAKKETFAACRGAIDVKAIQYSSGRITSLKSFSQQFGYFEARFKFPSGAGFWPAFWLLPTSGFVWEIDIMEAVGKEPNTAYLTYHAWATQQHEGFPYRAPAPLAGEWHTYGVDWQPNSLVWYVDGIERGRSAKLVSVIPKTPGYILLNLAVGGAWPGPPTASTVFPNQMLVDYVKVWKRVADGKPDTLPPSVAVTAPDVKVPPAVTPTPTPVLPPLAIMLSSSANRAAPVSLQGATPTLDTPLYVFTSPDIGVQSVSFWLDSATPAKPTEPPVMVENVAPFDLGGTDAVTALAKPFSLSALKPGLHTITVRATNADGTLRDPVTASFTVNYPPLDAAAISARLKDASTAMQAIRDQLTASGVK